VGANQAVKTKEDRCFVLNHPPEWNLKQQWNRTPLRADGIPNPRLSWQTRDGGNTRDVPGLRYTRSDGTLVFPPFPRSDYRQDVHDTVYQCLASNAVGSIVSREVHVRGGKSIYVCSFASRYKI
ncbi:down syndrome cell adhesion molecule-like protein Dscam2, partial [Trichonephila clavata]